MEKDKHILVKESTLERLKSLVEREREEYPYRVTTDMIVRKALDALDERRKR